MESKRHCYTPPPSSSREASVPGLPLLIISLPCTALRCQGCLCQAGGPLASSSQSVLLPFPPRDREARRRAKLCCRDQEDMTLYVTLSHMEIKVSRGLTNHLQT